jgi:hypothetical protein
MKYSKKYIEDRTKRLADGLISEFGLRIAKRIISDIKKQYSKETKRRRLIDGKKRDNK